MKDNLNIPIGAGARPAIYATVAALFCFACYGDCWPLFLPGTIAHFTITATFFLGTILFAMGATWFGRVSPPPRWAMRIGLISVGASVALFLLILLRCGWRDWQIGIH